MLIAAVAKAIRAAGMPATYREQRISPRQLADVLTATARGYKPSCRSPEEFKERFAVALRALCSPFDDAAR